MQRSGCGPYTVDSQFKGLEAMSRVPGQPRCHTSPLLAVDGKEDRSGFHLSCPDPTAQYVYRPGMVVAWEEAGTADAAHGNSGYRGRLRNKVHGALVAMCPPPCFFPP